MSEHTGPQEHFPRRPDAAEVAQAERDQRDAYFSLEEADRGRDPQAVQQALNRLEQQSAITEDVRRAAREG
jgi:hypothetical protein